MPALRCPIRRLLTMRWTIPGRALLLAAAFAGAVLALGRVRAQAPEGGRGPGARGDAGAPGARGGGRGGGRGGPRGGGGRGAPGGGGGPAAPAAAPTWEVKAFAGSPGRWAWIKTRGEEAELYAGKPGEAG